MLVLKITNVKQTSRPIPVMPFLLLGFNGINLRMGRHNHAHQKLKYLITDEQT